MRPYWQKQSTWFSFSPFFLESEEGVTYSPIAELCNFGTTSMWHEPPTMPPPAMHRQPTAQVTGLHQLQAPWTAPPNLQGQGQETETEGWSGHLEILVASVARAGGGRILGSNPVGHNLISCRWHASCRLQVTDCICNHD